MISPLPLGLDATYAFDPQPTGVAVYSRALIAGLGRLLYPELSARLYCRPHRYLRAFRSDPPLPSRPRLLTDWIAPNCEIFHGLNQRLPRRLCGRSVSTFHDLFVMTSEYSSVDFRARFTEFARDAAQRSDLIVAVSQFTASQIESLLGIEPSRIRVIPHGVYPVAEVPPPEARLPIVLHVGTLQTRKNVVRLIEAFEAVPPPWELVLAGGDGYGTAAIHDRIERSAHRARIRREGYVSEERLASLYRQAAILAFPSLDEGFGLPILDAMANGVAVVTSNRSATVEVVGNAGIAVDPESVEDLGEALRKLTNDEVLRAELVQRGLTRAAAMSWDNAVEATRAVYRELGL